MSDPHTDLLRIWHDLAPLVGWLLIGLLGGVLSFLMGQPLLCFWFFLAGSYCSLQYDDVYINARRGHENKAET